MTGLKKTVKRRGERPLASGRRLIVSLEPGDILGLREERRRITYRAALSKVFWVMARWYAAERAAERKRRKNEQRKSYLPKVRDGD